MSKIEQFINQKISEYGLAKSFFFFILVFLSVNSIYNSLLSAFGAQYPLSTFLFEPQDRFADFINVALSYPIGIAQSFNNSILSGIFVEFSGSKNYGGINELLVGENTHFHLPPLTTLFNLLSRFVAQYFNIYLLFLAYFIFLTYILYKVINKIIMDKKDSRYIFFGLLLSYPFLLLLTRGNLYSYITFLALIFYIYFSIKNKFYLALTLLSIAVNIRPNSIIFIFFILFSIKNNYLKYLIYFLILNTTVFFVSLKISNYYYPEYNFNNFLIGLSNYYKIYVQNGAGIAYGSSFQSVFTIIFGDNAFAKIIPLLICGLLFAIGLFSRFKGLIKESTYLYIICSIYMLATSVFGDYHLAIFVAPILVLYYENKSAGISKFLLPESVIVFIGCVFNLSPKNFIFIKGISAQVIMNPVFTCSLLILLYLIVYRAKNLKYEI